MDNTIMVIPYVIPTKNNPASLCTGSFSHVGMRLFTSLLAMQAMQHNGSDPRK